MLHNPNWDRNSISSILNRAADLLVKHGHIKHYLNDPTGLSESMCALGAINRAMTGRVCDWWDVPENREAVLEAVMNLELPWRGDRVPALEISRWNNAPKRTAAEVISALRQAAQAALQQEVSHVA